MAANERRRVKEMFRSGLLLLLLLLIVEKVLFGQLNGIGQFELMILVVIGKRVVVIAMATIV